MTPETKPDEMVTLWYDDLVDESTEHRYPYTATLTKAVEYVPPEYAEAGMPMLYGQGRGTRLVGGALPIDAFPPDTFDERRNVENLTHGDVVFVEFDERRRSRAFHPRVTDAPDGLVVVAETTVATVPVISNDPTEVGK